MAPLVHHFFPDSTYSLPRRAMLDYIHHCPTGDGQQIPNLDISRIGRGDVLLGHGKAGTYLSFQQRHKPRFLLDTGPVSNAHESIWP